MTADRISLVLSSDPDLRALLSQALRERGFKTMAPLSMDDAAQTMAGAAVDLIVWDEPALDRWERELIQQLRRKSHVPVALVLTPDRNRQAQRAQLIRDFDISLVGYKPIVARDFTKQAMALLTQRDDERHSSGNFAVALEPLRREFAAHLPERLQVLEAAVANAKLDRNRLAEARQLAHRIRGSAGSYGFALVGTAVGSVEDLLGDAPPPPAALRRFYWEDVQSALAEAQRHATQAPRHEPGASPEVASAARCLLVVDADPDFLHLARQVGRKLVVEVVTAESADEALQRARSTPLLGAILGLPRSGCDWSALVRALRNTAGNEQVPIAFASIETELDARMAALEAGASRFFEKPVSEDALTILTQDFAALAATAVGRVLIIDDDPDVVQHYTLLLRNAGIEVAALPSEQGIVEELERIRPDVVLLDVNLPEVSGLDVCRALRMSPQFQLLPILIVTALTDDGTRLSAFRAGATDVVPKPAIPEELLARVGVQLERARLLRDRADRDALSGLLLRRAFIEAFQRSLATAARHQQPLSLVLLDLDSFKRVNDDHGHLAGDQVLAGLGLLLGRRFRVEDLRGRWGGEEFVLAFPGANAAFAEQATRRLLAEFSQLRFVSDRGVEFHVTFTAGVAEYPAHGTSLAQLLRQADQQLYLGKKLGRNRICVEPPALPTRAKHGEEV